MEPKHWMIRNHFANGMYLGRNGGWTTDKVAAARYSTSEKKAMGEKLGHIAGGKWVYDHATAEDLIFTLEVARDNVVSIAKAMAVLGMGDGVKTLASVEGRLTDAIRLAVEMKG